MLDQVLAAFRVTPDYDLDVMQPGQTLAQSTARILAQLEPVLAAERPGMVLVQGDTTTTLSGALAAFYQHIPVGHVEAGLRTGDLEQPFPGRDEPGGDHAAGRPALRPHRAGSAAGWRARGCREHIFVTGNSGIDAVLYIRDLLEAGGDGCGEVAATRPFEKADRGDGAPARELWRWVSNASARALAPPGGAAATYRSPTRCIAIRT